MADSPDDPLVRIAATVDRLDQTVGRLDRSVVGLQTAARTTADHLAAQRTGLNQLRGWIGDLAGTVANLGSDLAAVKRGAKDKGEPAKPSSWLLQPDQAELVMVDLEQWLQRVYLRYDDVRFPSCWFRHPGVVEELLAVRAAHHDAYEGDDAATKLVSDWHERLRPGAVRRINAVTCSLDEHRDGAPMDKAPAPTPLAAAAVAFAAWWSAGGCDSTPPWPRPSELERARLHDQGEPVVGAVGG